MGADERIKALMSHYNLTVNQFVDVTGVKTRQAVYDLLNRKTKSISLSMCSKILSYFVDVDKNWLLTGEGEMIKRATEDEIEVEENKEAVMLTPDNGLVYYYDMVATASDIEDLTDNELNQPYITLYMPGYEGCVGFNVAGDSMTPTAKHRDIVAIERKQVETIINGEIYFIVTRDGQRMIKRLVQLGKDEDGAMMFRCISDNPNQELYAPFVISGDRIHTISRVKGFISHTQLG